MSELLGEYGLFLLQAITIVIAILVVVSSVVAISAKAKHKASEGDIEVKHLNQEYQAYQEALEEVVLDHYQLKALHKQRKAEEKLKDKKREKLAKQVSQSSQENLTTSSISKLSSADSSESEPNRAVDTEAPSAAEESTPAEEKKTVASESADESRARLFVIDFDGDIRASATDAFAKEITAILQIAEPEDEVVVRLESPGGVVHGYGLAASQLDRIKKKHIQLTVAVDKVAASGGYMMACLADKIISAPFAILGSIGVLAQMPNFHRLLKKHDIDYEVLTAGEYKRTLTMFGENNEKGREKFMEELEETHALFKDHVSTYRPKVDIEQIATGEHWYGRQAVELKLVDELMTSDEYLISKSATTDIYHIAYEEKKPLLERLGGEFQGACERAFERILTRLQQRYIP